MAVFWKPDSIKVLNSKKQQEQTQKDEISEIQDALIELAEIITTTAMQTQKDGETNG